MTVPGDWLQRSWIAAGALTVLTAMGLMLSGCRPHRGNALFEANGKRPAFPIESKAGEPAAADPSSGEPSGPQTAMLYIAQGRTFEQQDDLKRAKQAYRKALQLDPKRAEVHHRLAKLYDRTGQFDSSAEHYLKALQHNPGNANVFCDVGYSLYLQERFDAAEMNLRQAIAIDRDHQRARNNLGLLLVRRGRAEEALTEFRRGGCSPAEAHINAAVALMLDGRFDNADRHYQKALAAAESSETRRVAEQGRADLMNTMARMGQASEPGSASSGRVRLTSGEDRPSRGDRAK